MKADEWRTVYDSPFDVTRARDLLIESVGGEASEQLRGSVRLRSASFFKPRRFTPGGSFSCRLISRAPADGVIWCTKS
jgi:hypothetical protein